MWTKSNCIQFKESAELNWETINAFWRIYIENIKILDIKEWRKHIFTVTVKSIRCRSSVTLRAHHSLSNGFKVALSCIKYNSVKPNVYLCLHPKQTTYSMASDASERSKLTLITFCDFAVLCVDLFFFSFSLLGLWDRQKHFQLCKKQQQKFLYIQSYHYQTLISRARLI